MCVYLIVIKVVPIFHISIFQHGKVHTMKNSNMIEGGHTIHPDCRIALKFGGSKNLRIAVFERFIEIISRIRCSNEFMCGA